MSPRSSTVSMRELKSIRPSPPKARGLNRQAAPRAMIIRGRVINPLSDNACDYFPNGAVAIDSQGKIVAVGNFKDVRTQFGKSFEVVDLTENGEMPIISPAFSDVHFHWVQYLVRGQFGGALMPWLKNNIWPAEARYANPHFANTAALMMTQDLAKQGTVIGACYSSIHHLALQAFLENVIGYFIAGNVLMTQNSPEYLQQDADLALHIARNLAEKYGSSYAITPRFAPTCETATLSGGGKIAREKGTWAQTHLSENDPPNAEESELQFVKFLFPEAYNYTDVYLRAKLLGPHVIMGHVIHLNRISHERAIREGVHQDEFHVLRETGTNVAHCPTSNKELGSGRMPVEKMWRYGIPWALGSDIGAGPSLSMLHVMQGYLEMQAGITGVSPIGSLYRATLAGAQMLRLGKQAGNLTPGKDANLVILEAPGTQVPRNANTLIRTILDGDQAELENRVQRTFFRGRTIWTG